MIDGLPKSDEPRDRLRPVRGSSARSAGEAGQRGNHGPANYQATIVIVAPVKGSPGRFSATDCHDRKFCVSREPLLAAARILLAEGWPPDALIVMRHAGADHDALRARLGVAARLTVGEARNGCPTFRSWKAPPGMGRRPDIAQTDVAATHLAGRVQKQREAA